MKIFFVSLRNGLIKFYYRYFLKPIFFLQDPEDVHDRMIKTGNFLGRFPLFRGLTKLAFDFSHLALEQTILGIKFKNPIGLSAGFDKDGYLTQILPNVGFGFAEIGSITGEFCKGNPRPWMWRLPKSQSLVVYYGLKNEGCEAIAQRLAKEKFKIPIGISVAKTNSPDTVEEQKGIADYLKAYKTFVKAGIGDYFTINISCPNAFGGEPFTDPVKLEHLLSALRAVEASRPMFIKMPADIEFDRVDEIIEAARRHKVSGFICSNLTKSRDNPKIVETAVPSRGGLSGKVVQELSDILIGYIYQKAKGEFLIIGCGGVFSAQDAYRKIKLGASLIQLITGMIYQGPQLISEINLGLVCLLKKDGYQNIGQAVGKSAKV